MIRVSFLLLALVCFYSTALAQVSLTGQEKKTEAGKSKDADLGKTKLKDANKSKSVDKQDDVGKDQPRSKISLDKLKTPGGAIVIVVDELLKAMDLIPDAVLLTPEKYQELQDRIKFLERQIKIDKKVPHACRLQGKLEGDFLALRAEFAFSTDQPKTTVSLGLLGAHLTDEGDLDQQIPVLDSNDEGFVVLVEKPGNHQLVLRFRARVDVKKSPSGGSEHGLELGLPGAGITTLQLELPANVKELRWNDNLEKAKPPGRWTLGLERAKVLSLSWKEPITMTGNAPLTKVEGQINVRVDETHVNINAELFLEDLRFQTKEWQLLLPAQAKVEIKPPVGLSYDKVPPDGKTPYYTLRSQEATAERWQVSVFLRVPRPNPGTRLPIGPFLVLGAYQQQGTINVQMATDASLGQRLVVQRLGEVYQTKNTETESTYVYMLSAGPDKNLKGALLVKAPLELEWRNEKNQVETFTDHAVKLKTSHRGWEVETTTLIKVKAFFAGVNGIDLRMPLPRSRGMSLFPAAIPGVGFPAAFPWNALWSPAGMPWADSATEESTVTDVLGNPLKVIPQDAFGKARVVWERSTAKEITLILKNLTHLPPEYHRFRLELPRPLNTQDRGASLSLQGDDRIELLQGPPGLEEPTPEKQHFDLTFDQSPFGVDLAWKSYQREVTAHAVVDVLLYEHTAQVRQVLRLQREFLSLEGADVKLAPIRLQVPRVIEKLSVVAGGEITNQDVPNQSVWVRLQPGKTPFLELVLQYDLAIVHKQTPGELQIPFVWPAPASRRDVKVRFWSESGGVKIRLADELFTRGSWKERSIEPVPEKDHFPLLVLQGSGAQLALTVKLEDSATVPLAAFLADRGLVQIAINDDGSQFCQARFLIRKINSGHLDIELPQPIALYRDQPAFLLGKRRIYDWKPLDANGKTIRLRLNSEQVVLPAVLEIAYTLPAEAADKNTAWRTTLYAPQFRSQVVIGQLRWHLVLPAPVLATSLDRQVRPDSRWSLHGWLLTPEPSYSSAELESWVLGKESTGAATPVTFGFSCASLQPHVIHHLPRQGWLLGCSGAFLVLALAIYFAPAPRVTFWFFLLTLGVVLLVLGIVWPALLPPVLFGSQPGLVLLVVFVGIQWFWQERYRRQLVFLPAFSRTKPGSTLVRTAVKRPREASTIDAPPPEGLSAPASASSKAGL